MFVSHYCYFYSKPGAVQRSFLKEPNNNTNATPKLQHQVVWHPAYMNDSVLWDAFRGGDEKALVTIFNRFLQPLYNYGYKLNKDKELVKDTIQELFAELWQKRERLGETDSIKLYLFKSLRRKLNRLNSKLQKQILKIVSLEQEHTTPSHEFALIAEQTSQEQRERVMAMLNKLTRREREVIFLRYFEELECSEIAQIMDLSKQAVYNLVHHALDHFRKLQQNSTDGRS